MPGRFGGRAFVRRDKAGCVAAKLAASRQSWLRRCKAGCVSNKPRNDVRPHRI